MVDRYLFLEFDVSMKDECVDLLIKVFTKEPWNDVFESRDVVVAYFDELISSNKFMGYVVKEGDEIIAVSVGFTKPWIKGVEYYIDSFYVDYNRQRSGVGGYFVKQIKGAVKAKNLDAIVLTTSRDYPSHRFYEKAGFETLEDVVFLAFSEDE